MSVSLRMVARLRRVSNCARLGGYSTAVQFSSKEMESAIPPEQLQHFPQVGRRERVGHGRNGMPNYFDCVMFPYPAIRYGEWDSGYDALKRKEAGDWKSLTAEDKKQLYRHSYRYTFSETTADTGRWKLGFAAFLLVLSGGCWTLYFFKRQFGPELPPTYSDEWLMRSMWKQVMLGFNPVQGVGSKFDYENNRWKE